MGPLRNCREWQATLKRPLSEPQPLRLLLLLLLLEEKKKSAASPFRTADRDPERTTAEGSTRPGSPTATEHSKPAWNQSGPPRQNSKPRGWRGARSPRTKAR